MEPNHPAYSTAQKRAMECAHKLADRFGKDRWFTADELPGTAHSPQSLAIRGDLERMIFEGKEYFRLPQDTNSVTYDVDDVYVTLRYPKDMSEGTAFDIMQEIVQDQDGKRTTQGDK